MEQIKAMFEAMAKDVSFSGEMTALLESGDVLKITAAAAEKGFVFTVADWKVYTDWSGTLSAKSGTKELSPDELEQIAGGRGAGKIDDPYIAGCWFHVASEAEFRDGLMRRRCNQFACKAICYETNKYSSYQCGCWGTAKCVGSWHSDGSC